MYLDAHKLKAGLLLREFILINRLLFSAEAGSAVSEKQLARLEEVDNALLRQLTGGHSKYPSEQELGIQCRSLEFRF